MTPNDTENEGSTPLDTPAIDEAHDWRPSARQSVLIEHLAAFPFPKLAEACRTLGIPVDTGKRWHSEPNFRMWLDMAYRQGRDELRGDLNRDVMALGQKAITVKAGLLDSLDPQVQSRESTWVLEKIIGKAPATAELDEVEEQIARFEQMVLEAVGEVSPDVRAEIEANLRRRVAQLTTADQTLGDYS